MSRLTLNYMIRPCILIYGLYKIDKLVELNSVADVKSTCRLADVESV